MRFLAFFLCIIFATSVFFFPLRDPDLWWHITVGRWILSHGTLPQIDYWNAFSSDAPWLAYSWSNEVLYALIENYFGNAGLVSLKILLALAFVLALVFVLASVSSDPRFGILATLLSIHGYYYHFGLRPQTLSWIYFILILYFSERISNKGIKKQDLIGVFLVMLFWANTHITTVFGLGVMAVWIFDLKGGIKCRPYIAVCTGFLGTLFTPYYGREWLTFLYKADHPFSQSFIKEFQPTSFQAPTGIFLLAFIFLLLAMLHRRPRFLPPNKLLCCIAFIIAAMTVTKFLPYALLILSFAFAIYWRDKHLDAEVHQRSEFVLGNVTKCLSKPIYLSLGSILLLALVFTKNYRLLNSKEYSYIKPDLASSYILENKLAPPIFNNFGDGGYLIYALSDDGGNPKVKVSIDGRTNVNSPEIMEKFLHTLHGDTKWKESIDFVDAKTLIWGNQFPLVTLLELSTEWNKVYSDAEEKYGTDGWSVFVKNSSGFPLSRE